MKNLFKVLALVLVLAVAAGPAFAGTVTSPAKTVSASVDSTLSLSVNLYKNTATGPGTVMTNIAFGPLSEVTYTDTAGRDFKTLRSKDVGTTSTGAVVAMVSANSHGLPYTIKQTGSALLNGTKKIPEGSCVVVPIYATEDNGGQARPGTLGAKGSWVATDKVLYTSDAAGKAATIQAIYAVTDDPASGATSACPIDQAGGSYTATVTFSVTT